MASAGDVDDGQPEVVATDDQADQPVEVDRWSDLARAVLDAEGVAGRAELNLSFVDLGTIADLNGRFMDADGPTDVLAFPLDGAEPDRNERHAGRPGAADSVRFRGVPRLLGDVVICPQVAARNAREHAGTYVDEMALLVVHGVLHVLGHDHATASETDAMQRRERALLDRFHRSVA